MVKLLRKIQAVPMDQVRISRTLLCPEVDIIHQIQLLNPRSGRSINYNGFNKLIT
jgi:hypothetical protein